MFSTFNPSNARLSMKLILFLLLLLLVRSFGLVIRYFTGRVRRERKRANTHLDRSSWRSCFNGLNGESRNLVNWFEAKFNLTN